MTNIGSFSIKHLMAYQCLGERFGKVVVTGIVGSKRGNIVVSYICDCDKLGECELYRLKSRNTKSCGCLSKTHGESTTKLYGVWYSIKKRATLKTHKRYSDYGGRGIGICDGWLKYINFRNWALANGWKKGLTVEREDNDKGYYPGNCKIATYKEQNSNKRTTLKIIVDNIEKPLTEWAEIHGLAYRVLFDRVKMGWPQERLFIPVRPY